MCWVLRSSTRTGSNCQLFPRVEKAKDEDRKRVAEADNSWTQCQTPFSSDCRGQGRCVFKLWG